MPIGPYRLEISLQGFRTYVQTGIVLQVNANPVINASLALGNVEETVTVEAATPLVDVRSAGISEVVEQERIVELPLQGRQVTDLIVLAGGAVNTGRVSALSTSNSVASRWPAGCATASSTSSTAPRTTARTTSATCRSPSRTRCRSSASPAAVSPRRPACTRARRSTR